MQRVKPLSKSENLNYRAIDVFKFIAAILVVIIHANESDALLPSCFVESVSSLAVPFFFIVSGFFYKRGLDKRNSNKEKLSYCLGYVKKLLIIYLFYAMVNLPSTITLYVNKYADEGALKIILVMLRSYLLCGNGVVWYILTMAEAAVVIFLIDRIFKKQKSRNAVIIFLIIIGLSLGIVYDCLNGYDSIGIISFIKNAFYFVFSWSNNFIMKAVPYMGVGYLLYLSKSKIKIKAAVPSVLLFALIVINVALFFVARRTDSVVLQKIDFIPIINIFQAVLFFLIGINIPFEIKPEHSIVFRELSSSIYFLHTYFIYFVMDPIFGFDSFLILKVIVALLGSSLIYLIVKKTKIKPLMYVLNIKYVKEK